MVMRKVGKNASGKMEPGNALLLNGMGAHLHKYILTSLVNHLSEEGIEPDRIRGCVGGFAPCAEDIVADRGEEAALVTQHIEHFIKKRGYGGLAVGAGDARESQPARGMVIEGRGCHACCSSRVIYNDHGHTLMKDFRKLLTDNSGSACLHGLTDECMTIALRATNSYKKASRLYLTRVSRNSGDKLCLISVDLCYTQLLQYMF